MREPSTKSALIAGVKDGIPLLGGYIPVAVSFGLVSVQAGFSVWETVFISTAVYAGASQFLFVAMVATGAPLWLVVATAFLLNARHMVYGPNIAPHVGNSRLWPWLMHGLTDQIFALALIRLPEMAEKARIPWYLAAALVAWFSWIAGTALGAIAGEELTRRWPLLGEVMPFALPALFLVLLAPRFTSILWSLTLATTLVLALGLKISGFPNVAIPLAALCGAAVYGLLKSHPTLGEPSHG